MAVEKENIVEMQLSTNVRPNRTVDTVNSGSVGRVDWSPLCKITGYRPSVSKYGLPRFSPWEWQLANASLIGQAPSATKLEHQSKNTVIQISTALDKEQSENTRRLRQRAVVISVKHDTVTQLCAEISEEMKLMEQCKKRMQKAVVYLGVVEDLNAECREIRKNRLTEDLVRDEVEEELFQEKGLCLEIRQLYEATLKEHENQYSADRSCLQEANALWSNQAETLKLESEIIGLTSASDQISFYPGTARLEGNTSSLENWHEYITRMITTIQEAIDKSKAFRLKVHSLVLVPSAKDLKTQEQKVLRALLKRIDEVICAKKILEAELEHVLCEIARAEKLLIMLNKLGRQIDFNLKVVQTRLESRSHRPEVENCRDEPQFGLLREVKTINNQTSKLQAEIAIVEEAIEQMYAVRKKLERQIHVKRHSLSLDQLRCMVFRRKFPCTPYLLGY